MPITISSITAASVAASSFVSAAGAAQSNGKSVGQGDGRGGGVGDQGSVSAQGSTPKLRSRSEGTLDRTVRQASQETTSATVRLSSVGRVQSAFIEARDAARAVQFAAGNASTTSSADALRSAANRLVSSVNNASRVSDEVSQGRGIRSANNSVSGLSNTGNNTTRFAIASAERTQRGGASSLAAQATPEQERVGQAAQALNRSVNASSPSPNDEVKALALIGITVARDGQITLDRQRFESAVVDNRGAVEQTLGRFGQRIESGASEQLAADGNIGRAKLIATARLERAENRQIQVDEAQKIVQQRTESVLQSNQTNNPFLVGGVTAYRGIFEL